MRILNESAIREHALACSKQFRAGKFTRVGSEFLAEVTVDVEAKVRQIAGVVTVPTTTLNFVTGDLLAKIKDELNTAVEQMIENKVRRHPTVGVTLGRTR